MQSVTECDPSRDHLLIGYCTSELAHHASEASIYIAGRLDGICHNIMAMCNELTVSPMVSALGLSQSGCLASTKAESQCCCVYPTAQVHHGST